MPDSSPSEVEIELIQYGRPGFVGRFRARQPFERGTRVVLSGPRGTETGEVLVAAPRRNDDWHLLDGEILRELTEEDQSRLVALDVRGQELLARAGDQCQQRDLPLAFVDVEVTLDGVAILHALPWQQCDATGLLDELGLQSGLIVRLLDLSLGLKPEAAPLSASGCGKQECGTDSGGCSSCGTGGGCSTGSCSKGSVKSAEELTQYFTELREKMEAAGLMRTPLS